MKVKCQECGTEEKEKIVAIKRKIIVIDARGNPQNRLLEDEELRSNIAVKRTRNGKIVIAICDNCIKGVANIKK